MQPEETAAAKYRRELRDLLVAAIDFSRLPMSPPPTQNALYRGDLLRCLEFLSEEYLGTPPVAEGVIRPEWEEIADDVLTCFEHRRWDRLRPTPEGIRLAYRWWTEMNWLRKLKYLFNGGRVPIAGTRKLQNRYDFSTAPWLAWIDQVFV